MSIVVADMKRALYFGYGSGGHCLRGRDLSSSTIQPESVPGFPWDYCLLDTGLLKNRRVPDDPDGQVHWTCGGTPLWLAFFWWDRSGDARPASNSGFCVQGFHHAERQAAMEFACSQWPDVVARQQHPLVLVDHAIRKTP
jgi:hypothetical protein